MTENNPTNFRLLPIVLMVLILAAVALGGWWLKQQPPTPVVNSAGVTTLPQPKTQTSEDIPLTLFVPNDNAMLEKQTVHTESNSANFTDLAKNAFTLLLQKAPDIFPAGTQLLDVKTVDGGTAILNFNSKFSDASFWHGSSLTLMGTYSIVNTITAISADDFKAQQVQFQVEGKPLAVLGGLDVHDPLKPDMQWVQQN